MSVKNENEKKTTFYPWWIDLFSFRRYELNTIVKVPVLILVKHNSTMKKELL